jgi:hypothetical protein
MLPALHVQTTVRPGHRIEIAAPELPEGCKATVFVILEQNDTGKRPLFEVLGDYAGGQVFQTGEQVDAYLKAERDSWE